MEPRAYLSMAATESEHWWFSARRSILDDIISRLGLSKESDILEVGCGTGGNLRMLGRYGNVVGLEMDETARGVAMAKGAAGFDIRLGACPYDMPLGEQRFDLICLFDVLEHINEERETLQVLSGLLKPGGRLLITVPAYAWLFGPHDTFLHHKRRYRWGGLKAAVEGAGLVTQRLSYFNTLLFPLAALVRIKERIARDAESTGSGVPVAPLNQALKFIFASEKFLLRHLDLPFGVSLVCLAIKGR